MARLAKRAYRYRFYPTPGQAVLLVHTFGCVRYVYNRALAERSRAWTREHRRVTFAETRRMLTTWKADPETAWLYEVSNVALQQGLQHLQQAFVNFWAKRASYPHFKSKRRSRAAATFTTSGFRWQDGKITLAKMTEPLDIRWSRPLPQGAQPSTVTVSRDSAGRVKAGLKVASIHARIADRRRDHLHKLSTRIIRENQTVIIEDLSVRNLVRNHSLARAISDAAWSEFRALLEYKAEWYGRAVIAIDRFYPSSKTCSRCGRLLTALPLSVREWRCPGCGAVHDRDVNAAKVIRAEGLSVQACGDGVRPPRA